MLRASVGVHRGLHSLHHVLAREVILAELRRDGLQTDSAQDVGEADARVGPPQLWLLPVIPRHLCKISREGWKVSLRCFLCMFRSSAVSEIPSLAFYINIQHS